MAIFVDVNLRIGPSFKELRFFVCPLYIVKVFFRAHLCLYFSKGYDVIIVVDAPRFKVELDFTDFRVEVLG